MNIHGDIIFAYRRMKAFITLLEIRVTKKDTFKSMRIKLIPLMIVYMNITYITKNFRTKIQSRRNIMKL